DRIRARVREKDENVSGEILKVLEAETDGLTKKEWVSLDSALSTHIAANPTLTDEAKADVAWMRGNTAVLRTRMLARRSRFNRRDGRASNYLAALRNLIDHLDEADTLAEVARLQDEHARLSRLYRYYSGPSFRLGIPLW